MRVNER
ncbi:hypothetical protein D020_3943A, partial [Vibrio parahaemolyticus SBR10290]